MEQDIYDFEMSKIGPSGRPLNHNSGQANESRKGLSRKRQLNTGDGTDENSNHQQETGHGILTVSALIDGFVDFTTSHGVTHIHKSPGIIKRSVWTLLALASAVICGIHLWLLVRGFVSFAYTTQVTFTDTRKLQFPAVTVCNNNAIMNDALPGDIQSLIYEARMSSRSGNRTANTWPYIYQKISELFANLNSTERLSLGQSFDSLIIYCSFEGSDCDMANDFWQFHDQTHGNCYTFNSGLVNGQAIKSSTTAGSIYGLSLVLNIDINQYLSFLSEESGARVLIHNQKEMPFLSRRSIAVTPGLSNNIAIRREEHVKIGLPYNNCTVAVDSPVDNVYYEAFHANYSQWGCLQTCYQKELVKTCGCYDTEIPYKESVTTFENLTRTAYRYCQTDNSTDSDCELPIVESFQDGTLPCSSCFLPCTETRFVPSKSTSIYPASSYIADFMVTLEATHPNLAQYYNTSGELQAAIYENILKVNVYYQDLEYTAFTEAASYEDFQFASDLGGTFGLWIGWSALTIFEFLQLFMDLIVYFGTRAVSKRK